MSWHPAPPRPAPPRPAPPRPAPPRPAPPRAQAPWFKTITSLFQAPNVITRDGAGRNVVEAIADLAEAVRGLTEVVRTANRMNKPPDWPDDDT